MGIVKTGFSLGLEFTKQGIESFRKKAERLKIKNDHRIGQQESFGFDVAYQFLYFAFVVVFF